MFFKWILEKVIALEVLVVIGQDGCIFEVNSGGCEGVIIDDFVGGFGKKEVKMNVVFTDQVLVDWLSKWHMYFELIAISFFLIHNLIDMNKCHRSAKTNDKIKIK